MSSHKLTSLGYVALTALAGCTPGATTVAAVGGTATKGPIDGAVVEVFALDIDGSLAKSLGAGRTDVDGSFLVKLNAEHDRAYAVVVSGGTYVDEATGNPVDFATRSLTLLVPVPTEDALAITPLTDIAAAYAQSMDGADIGTAIATANAATATAFGLPDFDIYGTIPADLTHSESATATRAQWNYGALFGGLSQVCATRGLPPQCVPELIAAMREDFSDGRMDGFSAAGAAIARTALAPSDAMAGLPAAINTFLSGPQNVSGLGWSDSIWGGGGSSGGGGGSGSGSGSGSIDAGVDAPAAPVVDAPTAPVVDAAF